MTPPATRSPAHRTPPVAQAKLGSVRPQAGGSPGEGHLRGPLSCPRTLCWTPALLAVGGTGRPRIRESFLEVVSVLGRGRKGTELGAQRGGGTRGSLGSTGQTSGGLPPKGPSSEPPPARPQEQAASQSITSGSGTPAPSLVVHTVGQQQVCGGGRRTGSVRSHPQLVRLACCPCSSPHLLPEFLQALPVRTAILPPVRTGGSGLWCPSAPPSLGLPHPVPPVLSRPHLTFPVAVGLLVPGNREFLSPIPGMDPS